MGTYSPATPSTWTKGQILTRAFSMIGLGQYVFDLSAEQKAEALQLLTMMMGDWKPKADLSYAFPAAPDGDSWDDASGIPDDTTLAVAANVALALCPGYGKTPSAITMRAAVSGWNFIQGKCANIPEMTLPATTPLGAGNRFAERTFFPGPEAA